MSQLKMKTFDVHNDSPIVSEDSYSGFYRDFKMSYECMVEIRKTENILKSQAMLIDSLWEDKKKLQKENEKLKSILNEAVNILRDGCLVYDQYAPSGASSFRSDADWFIKANLPENTDSSKEGV